jgi:hypothetical protein
MRSTADSVCGESRSLCRFSWVQILSREILLSISVGDNFQAIDSGSKESSLKDISEHSEVSGLSIGNPVGEAW